MAFFIRFDEHIKFSDLIATVLSDFISKLEQNLKVKCKKENI